MIKINLLPKELIEKQAKKKMVILVVFGAVILATILILFLFVRIGIENTYSTKLSFMESELKKYQMIVEEVKKFREMTNLLESKKNIIENLMKERLLYPIFMEEFLKLLPEGVWINSLSTISGPSGLKITIACISFDTFIIADFVSNLENSQKFKNVELGSLGSASVGTYETIGFTIVCNYIR